MGLSSLALCSIFLLSTGAHCFLNINLSGNIKLPGISLGNRPQQAEQNHNPLNGPILSKEPPRLPLDPIPDLFSNGNNPNNQLENTFLPEGSPCSWDDGTRGTCTPRGSCMSLPVLVLSNIAGNCQSSRHRNVICCPPNILQTVKDTLLNHKPPALPGLNIEHTHTESHAQSSASSGSSATASAHAQSGGGSHASAGSNGSPNHVGPHHPHNGNNNPPNRVPPENVPNSHHNHGNHGVIREPPINQGNTRPNVPNNNNYPTHHIPPKPSDHIYHPDDGRNNLPTRTPPTHNNNHGEPPMNPGTVKPDLPNKYPPSLPNHENTPKPPNNGPVTLPMKEVNTKYPEIINTSTDSGSPSKNLVDYLQKLKKRETDTRRPSELACEYHKQEYERNTALNFHIFSGRTVQDGEYPFMVALGYLNSEENKDEVPIIYNCGGTLITESHVLTAAHCVANINNMTPVQVKLGSVNISDTSPDVVQIIKVQGITVPSNYKMSVNYNDIAILRLKEKVNITDKVYPACLYTKPFETKLASEDDVQINAAGWGLTDFNANASNELRATFPLRIIEKDECDKHYNSKEFRKLPNGLDNKMICMSDRDMTRRSDACQGDSGGPLILAKPTVNWQNITVVGVTSFGQSCGSNAPGVYTSVRGFIDWIEQEVFMI